MTLHVATPPFWTEVLAAQADRFGDILQVKAPPGYPHWDELRHL
jgi:hypothetical protein